MQRCLPAALAAILLLAPACKRPAPDATPDPASAAAPASATAAAPASAAGPASASAPAPASASASASAAASASASAAGPRPLTPEEKAVADAFLKALGKGRRAARSKDFPKAIAAFDEALAKQPGDPIALTERGYARVLAGDHEAAKKDLEEARRRAGTPELLAQIYHNLGLCEDAAGNAVVGEELKKKAREIRAGAKQAKGSSLTCPAEAQRPGTKGLVAGSWKEAWKLLRERFQKRFEAPYAKLGQGASEEEIRLEITGGTDPGAGPWVYLMNHEEHFSGSWHAIGKGPDGKLVIFPDIAELCVARCACGPRDVRALADVAPRVVVEREDGMVAYMCEKKHGELAECSGDEGEQPVQSFCGYGTYTFETMFLDLAAREIPLVISESGDLNKEYTEGKPRVSVIPQGDAAMMVGAGCSGKVPLRP